MGRRTDRGKEKSRVINKKPGRPGKPKVCVFCAGKVEWVDYKDTNVLRRLMSDRGKIKARRVTGTCRQHQRDVAIAIKTARELALLPYVLLPSASDKAGGRGGRGGGRGMGRPGMNDAAAAPAAAEADGADEVGDDADVDVDEVETADI